MMRKSFQCPFVHTVYFTVSVQPYFRCHHLAGAVVHFVLLSFLCYGMRCPLQAPLGCHIFQVHQDLPSTAPTFPLRKTSSCRWIEGPGSGDLVPSDRPITRAHGPGTNCACEPKDSNQENGALLETPTPGAHEPSIHHVYRAKDPVPTRHPWS